MKPSKTSQFFNLNESNNPYEGNIEKFIGYTKIPTGLVGPLLVNGNDAKGLFNLPVATTEGALVASYNRGCKATREAGGVRSICLEQKVQRAPLFKFTSVEHAFEFAKRALDLRSELQNVVRQQSKYAQFVDLRPTVEGNHLILTLEFETGDAAGQNMVTFCAEKICEFLLQQISITPEIWFVESNFSGDKKSTARVFSHTRGKKVSCECVLPVEIVKKVLKTTPDLLVEFAQASISASIQSGASGIQAHYANGLAALFIATGQDVACVAEAAMGITRFEKTRDGDLYASVTLPNLIVGTVGGGTGLPTQKEALEIMDCFGPGKAKKYAEITAAFLLAGELSIASAISNGHFTRAHKVLGRKKK